MSVGRDREGRECEILKGGGGDARLQEKHIELQFPPNFVRGWSCLVVLFGFSCFKRLFISWYKWAHLDRTDVLWNLPSGGQRMKILLPPEYINISHPSWFLPAQIFLKTSFKGCE